MSVHCGIRPSIESGDTTIMNTIQRARTRALALCCLPLAGAALSTSASAQSSVTLYGVVDNALTYASNQHGSSNVYMSQGNLQASKFGLLGSEDLGGGTKAIFRLESGFNSLTGAQSSAGYMFNRQAYVGLSNDRYGTVTLGRQYTPYFQMVGGLGPTGVLTGATGAHPGDLDALDTTLRFNNSITYLSPTIAGLQASAQYALGGVPGSIAAGGQFSAALRYDYQPFSIAAGYVKLKDIATSGALGTFAINSPVNSGYASARSAQLFAAAGRYTWHDLMVGLNYSNVQYAPGNGSMFHDKAVFNTFGAISTYRITQSVTVGGGYSFTQSSKANGISDPAHYHQISLEQTYNLSARTTLYALQAYQHASGKTLIVADGATSIIDAVAVVGDSQNTTPSSGPSQFVGMVGLRHAF
jgi:predicted porin